MKTKVMIKDNDDIIIMKIIMGNFCADHESGVEIFQSRKTPDCLRNRD